MRPAPAPRHVQTTPQALGRLPWLAPPFLRSRLLRARRDILSPPSPVGVVRWSGCLACVRVCHAWLDGCRSQVTQLCGRVGVAEEIRADMVANVLSVVVSEGVRVCDGDTLVILESMKMEIPVITEVPGTVTTMAVTVGDVVQSGDLIAVVE